MGLKALRAGHADLYTSIFFHPLVSWAGWILSNNYAPPKKACPIWHPRWCGLWRKLLPSLRPVRGVAASTHRRMVVVYHRPLCRVSHSLPGSFLPALEIGWTLVWITSSFCSLYLSGTARVCLPASLEWNSWWYKVSPRLALWFWLVHQQGIFQLGLCWLSMLVHYLDHPACSQACPVAFKADAALTFLLGVCLELLTTGFHFSRSPVVRGLASGCSASSVVRSW